MADPKRVAVVLSGCGVYDGAEIHESVLTMLALDQQRARYQCFAPDMDHHHVINHISGEEMDETRNVLVEAARHLHAAGQRLHASLAEQSCRSPCLARLILMR